MALADRVLLVVERIAAEFKSVRSDITAGSTAIQGEIDTLSDVVATKAAAADLTAAVGSIDDLSDVVAAKANTTDVTASLAGKANSADLDNVFTIASDAVPKTTTVAGKALTGNITLAKGDVGLGSVDNTSDANKPVSTAQQTALNGKVNTADVAGLNTVGWGRSIFIANGGTVPGGTPPYTIVIELPV